MAVEIAPFRSHPVKTLLRRQVLRAALLMIAVVAAYWPVHKATYVWDDDQSILQNQLLHQPAGIRAIWLHPEQMPNEEHFWPINYTTLWLERQLVGERPAVSHWINVAVHIGNALLLWRLLTWLMVPGAWFAAMIFALHPTRAEAVAWMLERNGLLATMFSLGCMLTYLRFMAGGLRRLQAAGLGLLALALLSKTMVVALPIAVLVVWWWQMGRLTWSDVRKVAPLFIVTVLLVGYDFRVARGHGLILSGLTLAERLQLVGAEFWFYLLKWTFPYPLIAVYPRWDVQGWPAIMWLLPAAVVAAIAALWVFRKRIGRGSIATALLFGLFVGPVLGLVDFNYMSHSFVADRFAYAATAPLGALFAAGAARLSWKARWPAWCNWAAGGALCVVFGALTFQRAATFENLHTFSVAILQKNPNAWSALGNEANWLKGHGKIDEAIPLFQRAVELRPEVAVTHNVLGSAYADKGDRENARAEFEKAIEAEPGSPLPQHNLGLEYFYIGNYKDAVKHLGMAASLLPNDAQVLGNYGAALKSNGNLAEAISYLRKSVALDAGNAVALHMLAGCEYEAGELEQCIAHLREAVKLKPDEAEWLNELAWHLASAEDLKLRRPQEAIELAQKACEMTSRSNPAILDTLAVAFASAGRFDDALATSEQAVKLLPADDTSQVARNIRKRRDDYKSKASRSGSAASESSATVPLTR